MKGKARKREGYKRGLSPVIATVLLIGIVVVSGLITFTWFKGFTQEAVTKSGQNAQLVCNDVGFEASYSGNSLFISNDGNIPIYGVLLKIEGPGGFETRDVKELSNQWPDEGLDIGGAASVAVGNEFDDASKVTLIPVLRGNAQRSGGEASFVCDDRHGVLVTI